MINLNRSVGTKDAWYICGFNNYESFCDLYKRTNSEGRPILCPDPRHGGAISTGTGRPHRWSAFDCFRIRGANECFAVGQTWETASMMARNPLFLGNYKDFKRMAEGGKPDYDTFIFVQAISDVNPEKRKTIVKSGKLYAYQVENFLKTAKNSDRFALINCKRILERVLTEFENLKKKR